MSAQAHQSTEPRRRKLRHRLRNLMGRMGVRAKRLEERIDAALEVLSRYGIVPTIAVAVPPFADQKHLLRFLQGRGAEIALLTTGPEQLQSAAALEALKERGVTCRGLRARELRPDQEAAALATEHHLDYASTSAYVWPVMEDGMLSTIGPMQHSSPFTSPVLPRLRGDLVEVPVSLPDDGLSETQLASGSEILERRFASILERVRDRGELFVVRLTQRNLQHSVPALERLLAMARHGTPPVWIAPLGEVARWWQRKAHARARLEKTEHGYQVRLESPPEARLLGNRQAMTGRATGAIYPDDWIEVDGGMIEIACQKVPIIALGARTGSQFRAFLEGEGFLFEDETAPGTHAIHFNDPDPFGAALEFKALAHIQCIAAPLVRLARWPHGFGAALSVTIELDSVHIADFFRGLA
ncbi:MAG: hypothetical protein U1E76_05080 [Planctomycetota bacterium]